MKDSGAWIRLVGRWMGDKGLVNLELWIGDQEDEEQLLREVAKIAYRISPSVQV